MASEAELKAAGDKYIPKDYAPTLYKLRHSLAHVLAQAVVEKFPQAKPTIGPPIEYGLYYDFDLDVNPTDGELEWIANRMKQIIKGKHPFKVREISADEGRELFKDNPYKIELIDGLTKGKDEYGDAASGSGGAATITVYQQDTFVDLCRGPHVETTGDLDPKAFKITQVTGSYWRGKSDNKMLKRFHATAWASADDLKAHLARVEEAAKRDHRKVGRELELFSNEQVFGAGFPMLLPKGATVRRLLEQFITDYERKAGYLHVYTPDAAKVELYKISGHWDHYKDSMFPQMDMGESDNEDEDLVLRPMCCPHHIQVYKSKPRSYRDLPIRIAELGKMYRYERSGVVGGLSRVRCMTLNDAHLFVRPDQVKQEIAGVLALMKKAYADLGITEYRFRLSKNDDPATPLPPGKESKYANNPAMWESSIKMLRDVLTESGLPFYEAWNEAAFYGPKIDVQVKDTMGREETLSTIQADQHLPEQFKLEFKDSDDTPKRPVMIHRGVISTMERMMSYLIELYAGAFPVWLAPVQVAIVPIADRHFEFAQQLGASLTEKDYRVDVDLGTGRMQAKIRDAQLMKVPYVLVIGDKEMAANAVAVRLRTGEDLGAKPVAEFEAMLEQVVKSRTLKLVP
ncbi:threonyl-trna synthetase : Threonine--tRNA ligase OS=Herpetosiphon aurantiacus (strain ATCC 23779 / DSM 785) GN=thrS PE=3 SV=1: tRNA_SAD: tRNA-synt_2b: HGTP_anticodon [Gemmataceae bacterium]|nr:threonyl-trna synthetase : Threonine--tRNA ligase OS=Herpetosiphon aurantiacus (strain ATCC 23779 / DSM 785) GN=thrS PE=3 SV=1: tRNA_SAD: tRNA-synt_2b: HGTP_anticodon [Gemmataceae bacterium]VTT97698.1 threonyl-trna synthetase : Threonine--tRNA ligase OS=Herpetosiphon aurantiacus (strain ATCC 23779 / DSM 785) GN=thrS PE=3 SV=1: tRNA_SAD: tRNA-synt_2b: HGTP_anticodon [Gemmataceae bacterium]